jgi:hypothetical protein
MFAVRLIPNPGMRLANPQVAEDPLKSLGGLSLL